MTRGVSKRSYPKDRSPYGSDEEYVELRESLKIIYLELSEYFKRTSRFTDDFHLRDTDRYVEYQMEKALEIRKKMESYRKKWFKDWDNKPKGK